MKIAIVGAGVVGVATACELTQLGHDVMVFERRASAAEEGSYAPGALVGPALLAPWAVPGAMGSGTFGSAAGIEVGSAARIPELRWLWQWRASARATQQKSDASDTSASLQALAALSQLSQRRFSETVEWLDVPLESSSGALLLLRDERVAAPMRSTVEALRSADVPLTELDATAARQIEPGLAEAEPFAMALHFPGALAANCRQFAVLLRQAAQRLGAQFAFQSSVVAVRSSGGKPQIQLATATATLDFDSVVLCNGVDGEALLAPLGIRLGMVPLWGTSLTAPLREDAGQPQGTVIDVARQVILSRIGQRIRIAGGAELGRSSADPHSSTLKRLYEALDTWFPGCAARGQTMQVWRGVRPVRPSGLPALGASGLPGIWLNLAHGDMGWALASGCAQVLANTITGGEPLMDAHAMSHFGVKPPA